MTINSLALGRPQVIVVLGLRLSPVLVAFAAFDAFGKQRVSRALAQAVAMEGAACALCLVAGVFQRSNSFGRIVIRPVSDMAAGS